MFGFVNKRKLYQKIFNELQFEPKPTVQFSALFNSSWFIYGKGKDKNDAKTQQVNAQEKYEDYFDNLRKDGIKIFFDKYDYW